MTTAAGSNERVDPGPPPPLPKWIPLKLLLLMGWKKRIGSVSADVFVSRKHPEKTARRSRQLSGSDCVTCDTWKGGRSVLFSLHDGPGRRRSVVTADAQRGVWNGNIYAGMQLRIKELDTGSTCRV